MNAHLAEILFRVGARWRHPSLLSRYRFLKETESWSLEQLQRHQLEACREFLEFAGAHSPYYRRVFEECGFRPSELRSLEDLSQIPPVDKATLIESNAEIHSDYPFKTLFPCETSGTSGQVLTFKRDEPWDSANRAAVMRGYSWYGVRPWERNGYFWGYNIDPRNAQKIRMLDAVQNRFRVFSFDREEVKRFARKLGRASYVHGYSSMIYEVARMINENPDIPRPSKLKLVKGTSEKIHHSYHEASRNAFGQKVVSEYGAAESGVIAFECPSGSMHLQLEGCLVEEVEKEILVTNFLSYSFPVIRYKLGDYIQLAPESERCPCGMAHPIVRDVLGRVGLVVYGKQQRYPSLTFYYVFKNLHFERGLSLNYQAVQSETGRLTVKIEEQQGEFAAALREEMSKYFGDDLDVTYLFGQELHTHDGKRRDFVSLIPD